jgi:hypothetical protein
VTDDPVARSLPKRIVPVPSTVRVHESKSAAVRGHPDGQRLGRVEVSERVLIEHRRRAPRDSWIECPSLSEFEDLGSRLTGELTVVTSAAGGQDVRFETTPALLADELVNRTATRLQSPQDVKDPSIFGPQGRLS